MVADWRKTRTEDVRRRAEGSKGVCEGPTVFVCGVFGIRFFWKFSPLSSPFFSDSLCFLFISQIRVQIDAQRFQRGKFSDALFGCSEASLSSSMLFSGKVTCTLAFSNLFRPNSEFGYFLDLTDSVIILFNRSEFGAFSVLITTLFLYLVLELWNCLVLSLLQRLAGMMAILMIWMHGNLTLWRDGVSFYIVSAAPFRVVSRYSLYILW